MASQRVVGAKEREAALGRVIALGFAYPDAIDIRSIPVRGSSHVPVRGTASQTSSARSRLAPDPGPANAPTASQPQSHSPEDERSSAGGAS